MNKSFKILVVSNLVTLVILIIVLIKEQYPQRLLAKFKKEDTSSDNKKISYWLNRDGVLASLPIDSNSIIFLGTSLTEYFEVTELFHNCNIKNRGITADNTAGVLNRLNTVVANHPEKIFIEIGINDLGEGISKEILLSNYNKILDTLQLRCANAKLYIQSVFPVANQGHYPTYNNPGINEEIRLVNKELRLMADKRHITFIDLYSKFELNGAINPKYAIEDGIHFTGEAYALWTEMLKPYIAE